MTGANRAVAACSPESGAGGDGVRSWHRLMDDAFVRLWWSDAEAVTVEFDTAAADEVRQRLLRLVVAERRCGPMPHWQVRATGTHLRVRVTGPDAAATVAALMY